MDYSLTYRDIKKSALTYDELDNNFRYLSSSIGVVIGNSHTGSFSGSFSGSLSGSFTGSYNGSHTGSYTGSYTGSFSGSFTGSFPCIPCALTSSYPWTTGSNATNIVSSYFKADLISSGTGSIAHGRYNIASGAYSHAEGYFTTASGDISHAEGYFTSASGEGSHTEGKLTVASNYYSHAEGVQTLASGYGSHTQGFLSTASGQYSFAGGLVTKASSTAQTALGINNIEDTSVGTLFIIGNGSLVTGSNIVKVTTSSLEVSNVINLYTSSTAPSHDRVVTGSMYFDTSTNQFKGFNGSSWVILG